MTDFSSPFVTGAIVTKDGQRFPFWTQGSSGGDGARTINSISSSGEVTLAPELNSLAWIQEVNVDLQLAHLPQIQIQLAPPFREGIRFLNSELIEYGVSTLEVQLGYSGGSPGTSKLTPPLTGVITQPEVAIGDDVLITLNAYGVAGWSMRRTQGGRVALEGETRNELVQRIIEGPKGTQRRKLEFDDKTYLQDDEDTPEDVRTLWFGSIDYAQGGKSDWLAVWELCNGAKCRPYVDGNKIQIRPFANDLGRAPSKTFRMYDYPQGRMGLGVDASGNISTDPDKGVFPILSFSSPNNELFLPASARGFVMTEISDKNPQKEVERTVVDHESENVVGSNEGAIAPEATESNPDRDSNTDEGAEEMPGDPDDTMDLEKVKADFWREGNMGITVEIESIGVPDLIPGDTVLVDGLGNRFGHPRWGVFTVKHSIGLGGYTTSFSAVSNTDRILREGQQARVVNVTGQIKSDDTLLVGPDPLEE